MKKPVEKRLIQKYCTKDDFIQRGIDVWVRKTWFIISPIVIIEFILFTMAEKSSIEQNCLLGLCGVCILSWYLFLYIKGKKYWKENKDKQEPISIERLPDMWGRKRTWDENEKGH
jgi:hypothetical protein